MQIIEKSDSAHSCRHLLDISLGDDHLYAIFSAFWFLAVTTHAVLFLSLTLTIF